MVDWKKRIVTGVIAVPTLFFAVLFKQSLLVLLLVVSYLAVQEFSHIMNAVLLKQVTPAYQAYISWLNASQEMTIPVWLFLISTYFSSDQGDSLILQYAGIVMISVCGLLKYLYAENTQAIDNQTTQLLTFWYIAGNVLFFLLFIQPLGQTLYTFDYPRGFGFVLLWIITAFQSDNGALFMGSAMGRTLFCPRISPAKTWEGVSGAVLLSVLTNVILYFVGFSYLPSISLLHYIAIGLLGSVASVYGDLLESFIKRASGIKDSGSIFPGHGGILDRLDSLTFSAPVVFAYYQIFGLLTSSSVVIA